MIIPMKGLGLACCTKESYTADEGVNHSAKLTKSKLQLRTDM